MWWSRFNISAALLILQSCGYTLQHRLKQPFNDPRGIFIRVFDNQTDEIGAESAFTNALKRELSSHDEVRLLTRPEGGLELRGTITRIDHTVTSATDPGFGGLIDGRRMPAEIGISVGITLALLDTANKSTLWSRAFSFDSRLGAPVNRASDRTAASSTALITQSSLELQYQDMARDMMRDVYDEMVDLF